MSPHDDGYEVTNLAAALAKAKVAGVTVLAGPYSADGRDAAILGFPAGYVTEVHAAKTP